MPIPGAGRLSDAAMPLPSAQAPRELTGTQTHAHLRGAYARDAQAARLYEEFARIAQIEGYASVARVLGELAETHSLLAGGHLDFLRRAGDPLTDLPLGGTPENLRALRLFTEMDLTDHLPDEIATANAEGFPDIASWFSSLTHTRRAHVVRLEILRAELEDAR